MQRRNEKIARNALRAIASHFEGASNGSLESELLLARLGVAGTNGRLVLSKRKIPPQTIARRIRSNIKVDSKVVQNVITILKRASTIAQRCVQHENHDMGGGNHVTFATTLSHFSVNTRVLKYYLTVTLDRAWITERPIPRTNSIMGLRPIAEFTTDTITTRDTLTADQLVALRIAMLAYFEFNQTTPRWDPRNTADESMRIVLGLQR